MADKPIAPETHRLGHDLIVVGASAGGVEALKVIVGGLPADLPAAVLVVLHVSPQSPRLLADILNQAGVLPCQYAQDREAIRPGRIYLAPPDHHLMVEPGRLRVVRGPKENRARPAVDPLFRSAAAAYGPRVVGVVLTGNLNDGTVGLWAVKKAGGVAVVQDPAGILYPEMPGSAIAAVDVNHVAPLAEIPALLVRLVAQAAPAEAGGLPGDVQREVTMEKEVDKGWQRFETLGPPSDFGCPECGGVLNVIEEGRVLRFRCRVGHAYTAETLQAEQTQALEQALWVAVRTLEEKLDLQRRMAQRARERGHTLSAEQWQTEIPELELSIDLLYQILFPDRA